MEEYEIYRDGVALTVQCSPEEAARRGLTPHEAEEPEEANPSKGKGKSHESEAATDGK